MSESTLWCMHFIGADEVHAAPSFEEADEAARWCNWRFNQDRVANDVPMRFVVAVWPHSAEGHAESVKRWHEEWHPRGPAEAPGATSGDLLRRS
jgi:hypothetical protein